MSVCSHRAVESNIVQYGCRGRQMSRQWRWGCKERDSWHCPAQNPPGASHFIYSKIQASRHSHEALQDLALQPNFSPPSPLLTITFLLSPFCYLSFLCLLNYCWSLLKSWIIPQEKNISSFLGTLYIQQLRHCPEQSRCSITVKREWRNKHSSWCILKNQ